MKTPHCHRADWNGGRRCDYAGPGDFMGHTCAPAHERGTLMSKTVTTVEQAAAKVSNEVYKATSAFEDLEAQGLVIGNGHHMRQRVAEFAASLVRERWSPPKE